jgi:hypothetical protein
MMMRKKRTDPSTRKTSARVAAFALTAWIAVAFLPRPCSAETEQRPAPSEHEMTSARELVAQIIERYESERSYRISFTQES